MSPRDEFDSILLKTKVGASRTLRRLTPSERWCFVAGVLCLAGESPIRGALLIAEGVPATVEDIADQAGVSKSVAKSTIDKLIGLRKLEQDNDLGCLIVMRWHTHQPEPKPSDTREAWRIRKQRQRDNERESHADVTRDVTPMSRPQEKGSKELPPIAPDFEEWLLDHESVTGHQPPRQGTKARQHVAESFSARRAEGYSLDDLKSATIGAHEDPYRRENGYDTVDSVLRPTKIATLIAKGRMRSKPAKGGDALAAAFKEAS